MTTEQIIPTYHLKVWTPSTAIVNYFSGIMIRHCLSWQVSLDTTVSVTDHNACNINSYANACVPSLTLITTITHETIFLV